MESKIISIEAAFLAEGLDINKQPEVSHLENEKDQNAVIKNYQLDIVVRALNNEGQKKPWVADYSNSEQVKYENIYYHTSSGWSLACVDRWYSGTTCGSRRSFRTREIGRFLWENFSDLIKETL